MAYPWPWVECTPMIKETESGGYKPQPPVALNISRFQRIEPYLTSSGVTLTKVHSEGDDYYFLEPVSAFFPA